MSKSKMKRIWICVVSFAIAGLFVKAQEPVSDEWQNDYDSFYDYDFLKDEGEKLDAEIGKDDTNIVKGDLENDMKVAEEIEQFREANDDNIEGLDEVKEALDAFSDYQFEDNRSKESKSKEEEQNNIENRDDIASESNSFEDDDFEKVEESVEANIEDVKKSNEIEEVGKDLQNDNLDYGTLWDDDDDVVPLPVPPINDDEMKKLFEETEDILSEHDKENDDFEEDNDDEGIKTDNQPDASEIFDETKKILEESDDAFSDDKNELNGDDIDGDNTKDEIDVNDYDATSKDEEVEQDTVAKVYADLNNDLSKLMETLNKLSDDGSKNDEINEEEEGGSEEDAIEEKEEDVSEEDEIEDKEENGSEEDEIKVGNEEEMALDDNSEDLDVLDYEEKYGRPFREGFVLSQREDYYENIEDSNLSEIFAQNGKSVEEKAPDETVNIEGTLDDIDMQLNSEPNPDDDIKQASEILTKDDEIKPEAILYINDAIVASETQSTPTVEEQTDKATEKEELKTKMVDELTSSELDTLMDQFSMLHSEDLDVNSDDFDKHVAPIHMTLSVDESLIVTSPNYPNAYPTNNIVDWIFEGEGMGVELNITDFAVNGALGDYLLVKPGGVDETGHEGLVFSYRLKSERRYRFVDVNRMFVRFQSNPGMPFLRGFQFSIKLIAPLPEEPEPIPEPEPILTPPSSTITLSLGGVTLEQFLEIEEEFRRLLADMAAEYISANDIDPGVNGTSYITQITSKSLCNVHWPDFENCASVTFGVPLSYEDEDAEPRLNEEDLAIMWRTYINRDPFALRLTRMGIREFSMPNDSSVMTAWLVIAAGVVISMAMLAFVLWRFSCFEDYTRMKTFSDTDSLRNEKRDLDLYPTPHQTLPPLYSESEYKWPDEKYDDSTRVDMGGFANRSYARDELYDFDSDEDVIPNRDRYTTDV